MAYAIVAVLVLILDQAVKYWTTLNVAVDETVSFIPGFIQLTNLHNTGAAYGLLEGMRWLFIVLTIVFTVAVIYMLSKNVIKGKFGRWTILLVMAGGIGNCIDRIINGYVVDMFQFDLPDWFPIFNSSYPVFNVSDMCISVCGVLFCIWLIFHKSPKKELEEAPPVRKAPRQPVHPVRGPDYMSQLQKPVAEAKYELNSPESRMRPAAPASLKTDDVFSEWTAPETSEEPAAPAKAPQKPAEKPKAPGGDEFSLESIMAEFKDK